MIRLTDRQREVCEALWEGLTIEQAAERMRVTPSSADSTLRWLCRRLQVPNRTLLYRLLLREGNLTQ